MNGPDPLDQPAAAAAEAVCAVLPAAVVALYAQGDLGTAQAWSVEAHLPGCPACRSALDACPDTGRLAQNRAVLLVRTGLPAPGQLRRGPVGSRMLRRCGVPEHVLVLLAATPSLRRSWLAGVLLVLGVAIGAGQWAAAGYGGLIAGGLRPSLADVDRLAALVPFLVIAPLLPLAAVAAAFSPGLDPAFRLASAAPVSKMWLLCIRSVAVIAATLVPTALAALALPGPRWLAATVLLPALAVCAAALALASVVRPAVAVVLAGCGWMALVIGTATTAGRPVSLLGPAGQLTAGAVLACAAVLVARRRDKIDYGWMG